MLRIGIIDASHRMRILLDECVPFPMHKFLTDHDCKTAQQCGWSGIKNGELLRLAEAKFDLFITSDQNLRYQQNLTGRKISILELSTNKLRHLEAAAVLIQSTIVKLQPGEFRHLEIP